MSAKNKKQFGVWMDGHHATIVGRQHVDSGDFIILGHVKNSGAGPNSSEHSAHNLERDLQHKFFKEITSHMQNVDEIYVTGTGTAQEEFIHYLASTPQYKNAHATDGTSNKLEDDKLIRLIAEKFN
jgi:stalled ribosome rescue protein Dom34